ncbi:MAG: YbjN domain-containing protein [Amphiplicatus sp.]
MGPLGGAAQAQLSNPRQIVSGFSTSDLAAIAGELGYQSQLQTFSDGSAVLLISTPAGAFFAEPAVCENGVCIGLNLYATFGSASNTPLTAVNYFNTYRAFTKAFTTDGTVFLSRYAIADFGIPRGNIASNLSNFVARAVEFAQFLAGGSNGVSAKISQEESEAGVKASLASLAVQDPQVARIESRVKELIASGNAHTFKPGR